MSLLRTLKNKILIHKAVYIYIIDLKFMMKKNPTPHVSQLKNSSDKCEHPIG